MGSVSVAKIADIPVGGKIKVNVKGTEIMLANVGGAIYALENRCPHMGGSLADGVVEGSVIKCPRHGLRFGAPRFSSNRPSTALRFKHL